MEKIRKVVCAISLILRFFLTLVSIGLDFQQAFHWGTDMPCADPVAPAFWLLDELPMRLRGAVASGSRRLIERAKNGSQYSAACASQHRQLTNGLQPLE